MSESAESARLYEAARQLVPAGTHSNSRVRSPHPIYFERGEGAYLFDVDGNRHLDCTMGNGAVMLGHAHPSVSAAVTHALHCGLTTGYETRTANEVVQLLASMVPSFGKVRFANTGTEAVMHAIHIARAATGRQRIAKPEGSYHGWYDPVWVSCWPPPAEMGAPGHPASVPASSGLSEAAKDTLILPFNDVQATERLLSENGSQLAAVIVEPVMIDLGWIPATADYLEALRALTQDLGILLIFDELLTGFRLSPGGARETYGINPDLTLYGKALANGFPLAAVEGRPELLDLTDPTSSGTVGYVGTFNGHAISLAAAAASLRILRDGSAQARLASLTRRLQDGFQKLAREHGVDVALAGGGGHFQPYFTASEVTDYRTALQTSPAAYSKLLDACARRRILIAEKPLLHSALSTAHTEDDVDQVLQAATEAFSDIASSR
jgi:glutamate-1-semialdehyde 2,1-aminomutase